MEEGKHSMTQHEATKAMQALSWAIVAVLAMLIAALAVGVFA
jgi:hypothetical protein